MQMIWRRLLKLMMPIDIELSDGLVFGMRFGAPVMLGWTVLLVWAALRPLERRDVGLLTFLPVTATYTAFFVWIILKGLATPGQLVPAFVSQAVLYGLFGFGYLGVISVENRPKSSQLREPGSSCVPWCGMMDGLWPTIRAGYQCSG
jgi:hypothetical protein